MLIVTLSACDDWGSETWVGIWSKCWSSMTYRKQSNLQYVLREHTRYQSSQETVSRTRSETCNPHVKNATKCSSSTPAFCREISSNLFEWWLESLWRHYRQAQVTGVDLTVGKTNSERRKNAEVNSNHNKASTTQGYPFLVGRQRLPWVSVERPIFEQSILGRMEVIVVYPECALFIDTGRRYSLQSMTGHELHAKRSLSGNATDDLVDLRIIQG